MSSAKVQQLSLSVRDTQILKGVAVLLLLFHHLFLEGTGFDDVYVGQIPLVQTFGAQSKLCVAIFVFLSGYGLTAGAMKTGGIPNLLVFYRKRYVKLMVNFWLIWLLFVPVGVLAFNRTFPDVYGEHYMMRIFTDLLGVCSTSSYNPTWWFYGCIICLYILFPFLYKILDYWYLLIPLSAVLAFNFAVTMPGIDLFRHYLCVFLLGMAVKKICPPPYAFTRLLWCYRYSRSPYCLFAGCLCRLHLTYYGMQLLSEWVFAFMSSCTFLNGWQGHCRLWANTALTYSSSIRSSCCIHALSFIGARIRY